MGDREVEGAKEARPLGRGGEAVGAGGGVVSWWLKGGRLTSKFLCAKEEGG